MWKRISVAAFLALAPLAGMAATPKAAEACWICDENVIPNQCVFTGAQPGWATCTQDPITIQCHVSGDCIGR